MFLVVDMFLSTVSFLYCALRVHAKCTRCILFCITLQAIITHLGTVKISDL